MRRAHKEGDGQEQRRGQKVNGGRTGMDGDVRHIRKAWGNENPETDDEDED
jgi:hypothetical protein